MEESQLGTDLLSDVLSRLPLQTLAKLTCVSKAWRSLISHDPYFRALLRRRRNRPRRLLAASVLSNTVTLSPPSYYLSILSGDSESDSPPTKRFIIGERTEGRITSISLPWMGTLMLCYGHQDNFYLCNPTTHEWLKLPNSSTEIWYQVVGALAYLPNTNEYRVIKITGTDRYYEMQCEVLTVREGGIVNPSSPWKLLKNICPVDSSPGCYVNGRVYWLIAYNCLIDSEHPVHWDGFIVSFDVIAEEFNMVREPQCCSHDIGLLSLKEVRGNLRLVDWVDESYTKFDIWVMKGEDEAWEKQYTVNTGMSAAQRDFMSTIKFVNLWDIENDEEILVGWYIHMMLNIPAWSIIIRELKALGSWIFLLMVQREN